MPSKIIGILQLKRKVKSYRLSLKATKKEVDLTAKKSLRKTPIKMFKN